MIILHASLLEGEFLLWGEQPIEVDKSPGKSRKRSSTVVGPAAFPYGTPNQDLLTALHHSGATVPTKSGRSRPMTVWLPTVESMPVPSSPMIASRAEVSSKPDLVPWTVATCLLSAEETLDLLGACLGRLTLAPGIIVGRDLAFWATVLRFAGSFMPVVRRVFANGVNTATARRWRKWQDCSVP